MLEATEQLRCVECRIRSRDDAVGWKAIWTSDEPPVLVVYCPDRAEREFGDGDC